MKVGPIAALPALLREFGIDPAVVLARHGLASTAFDDRDNRLPMTLAARLIDDCARLTGCPHFGLRIGERFELSGLGLLGDMLRCCDSAGTGLRAFALYMHLHDRGAVPVLMQIAGGRVVLGYSVFDSGTPALGQVYDVVLAIGLRIMRSLCGPSWKPLGVSYACGAPADVTPRVRLFGVRPDFDAGLSGLTFDARWLGRHVEGADPVRYAMLVDAANALSARWTGPLADEVRRVLQPMVFAGTDSAQAVARVLSLHERTLRRQLAAEGTSLQRLGQEVRFEIASQLLRQTRLPLADIAAALHYAEAPAFTRAFGRWAGATPSAWRAAAPSPESPGRGRPDNPTSPRANPPARPGNRGR